ncbi:hypothetical protein ABTK74_20080, partial [Acinetobacter baumannii]
RDPPRLLRIANHVLWIFVPVVASWHILKTYCMNLNLVTLDAEAKKVIETPNAQSAKGIIAVHAQPAARKQHVETENRAP